MLNTPEILGEKKYRYGVNAIFEWESSEPLTEAPTLTVSVSPAVTGVMTAIHAALSVTDIGEDRRKLTLSAAATDVDGLQGRYGAAWLVTEEDGTFPVVITRITGTTLYLKDMLPRDIALTAPATIQFGVYTYQLTSAAVTGSILRNVKWEVAYTAQYGNDASVLTGGIDTGLLHVVASPFSTGLTHNLLTRTVASLNETTPRGQQSYDDQIQAGLEMLVLEIRRQLLVKGLHEDNIPAGQLLRMAHISYTLAEVYNNSNSELADRYLDQGRTRVEQALTSIWLDLNSDGVVDDGEVDTNLSAPTPTETTKVIANTTFTTPFSRGRNH